MKKKLIAFAGLFIFIYGLGTLLGCCGETLFYFNVKTIEATNATASKEFNDEKQVLCFCEYYLKMKMKVEYVAEVKASIPSLLPSAYALSCINQGEYGSKNPLDTILIHTVTKYDDNHLAGSCLNDITDVSIGGSILSLEGDLSNFMKEKKSGRSQTSFQESDLWFSFNKKPFFDNKGMVLTKQHQFVVTLKFQNQPDVVDTTSLMTLLPF